MQNGSFIKWQQNKPRTNNRLINMEDKLKEILDKYEERINRYQEKKEKLYSRLGFLQDHKFKEEERITLVQIESMDMLLYDFKNLHEEVRELLNKWQS